MVTNLRVISFIVRNSRGLDIRFTSNLDPLINSSNFSFTSLSYGVPDPTIETVEVNQNILTVTFLPLFESAQYSLTLQSSPSQSFQSINADAKVFEDGVSNVLAITGPEDPGNPIRDIIIGYLQNNIYNLNEGGLARTTINQQAKELLRALYEIRQLKSDNYLGFLVENEPHIRGKGPTDRLNEEGAYRIYRVSTSLSGDQQSNVINLSEFPLDPISLQSQTIKNEVLFAGAGSKTFLKSVLTLSRRFITKVISIKVAYQNGTSVTYPLSQYGYQLQDSRYDSQVASTLLTLSDNQVGFTELAVDSGFILPAPGDNVIISYEYKNKGREVIDGYTEVYQILQSVREVAEPLTTRFFLKNPLVVDSNGGDVTTGGIDWLDPEANPPFSQLHPAFTFQIPYRLDAVPASAGEWAIDYSTGEVLCWGGDLPDGTGPIPPTATYYYKKLFSESLDYTFDKDLVELVANPDRDLPASTSSISFVFRDNLVKGIDFKADLHKESLNERVENRLVGINAIRPKSTPVTNVFRIYNETSGEIYGINRWNDSTIYFTSSTPPNVVSTQYERVEFTTIIDEELIITSEYLNASSIRVLKINLSSSRIMAATDDVVGASWNSSCNFSKTDIFSKEIYWDGQTSTVTTNINRLTVGTYQIDYQNGIIYIGVAGSQDQSLGTISYKSPYIAPLNPHVLSVGNLYYSISPLLGINRSIEVNSFSEGSILPAAFDRADERFSGSDTTKPYVVSAGSIQLQDDIKDVRAIYDLYELNHSSAPLNFSYGSTASANIISLSPLGQSVTETLTIQPGGKLNTTFRSNGINIVGVDHAVRISDGMELADGALTFSNYQITLSGIGSPLMGQLVVVTYRLSMNGSATPIVDYNRGDYYVDYSFLSDEILISYEYGDNEIDFSESSILNEGDIYYATYEVGALRTGLLQNFGSLINIPLLNNLNVDLDRERYRDSLKAALQSFPKGPTVPAIKGIGEKISHIQPEIKEALFDVWSLGSSYLNKKALKTTGGVRLLPGKYDNGILIDQPNQTIILPIGDNLRLEEGTLQTWVIPEWNGLDNDATLTFQVYKDGSILPPNNIWIGADSHHPTLDQSGFFTVNRNDSKSPVGLPAAIYTNVGFFICYDNTAKVWKVWAKDRLTTDGYGYSGTIASSGEVYNVKFIPGLGEVNDVLRSDDKLIRFEFHLDSKDTVSPDGYQDGYFSDGYHPADGYVSGYSFDGISFMADDPHYLFDFGKAKNKERFSIYKDGKGYLNFRIFDGGLRNKVSSYKISADISSWRAGQKHHVAAGWRLNSTQRRDEMHLFIDGQEVPNIIQYGGRPPVSQYDRFRTVKPEIIPITISRPMRVGSDGTIQQGSSVITSTSINFTSAGILPGDHLTINEVGFYDYIVVAVNGFSLTLNSVMPTTLQNVSFTCNPITAVVSSPINLYTNIMVTILKPSGLEIEVPGVRADTPSYTIGKNALNQNTLTFLGKADPGDKVAIRTLGLNFRGCRENIYIWGSTTSVLKTQLPTPFNLDEVDITSVILPYSVVGPSNSTLSLGLFTCNLTATTQPSSPTEGRLLKVRVSAGNVSFSTATTVKITGTTAAGPTNETVSFGSAGTISTVNKFKTISQIQVVCRPIVTTATSVGVEILEADPITTSEGNSLYPVVRYSYQTLTKTTLVGTANSPIVTDTSAPFTGDMVGQKLVIASPAGVAGTYDVIGFNSTSSISISPSPPISFTGGSYSLYNVSIGRSGFQNGYFTLQAAGTTATPFYLQQGFYRISYTTHLQIPFSTAQYDGYIGSDIFGKNQAKAIIDELVIRKYLQTDTRVGESLPAGKESITSDFNRVKEFVKDPSISTLLHFNSLPLTNDVDVWVTADKSYIQSAESVSLSFGKSLAVINRPFVLDNKGYLSTRSEGTVEFWVSPRFDTYNDPVARYYFDASAATVEETVSISKGTIEISATAESIQSVKLTNQLDGVDYFVGGKLSSDSKTIQLGRALPFQQTPVTVTYIRKGLQGNRISIYKDPTGHLIFQVSAGQQVYQTQQAIFWQRDSWHKVRATFKFNRQDNKDEIRLWVDGTENGTVLFGAGLLFGQNVTFGQSYGTGSNRFVADINFHDPINKLSIGSDYLGVHLAQARIDNLRISNTSRLPTIIAGQSKDITYVSNLSQAFPMIADAYTTYLLDFSSLQKKIDDFAIIRNSSFGLFDFTIKIFDSFGIIDESTKVKEILETLIDLLKPANSRAIIQYG